MQKTRVNEDIRSKELRIIDENGDNIGVLDRDEAIKRAIEAGFDLIEISPNANPPVAKIMDYGKYVYEQKKKQKEIKAKSHTTETKNVQVKIGTGEHDLELKAKRTNEWLKEGHRVKIDLYLRGRAKYMEKGFLEKRLERILNLVTEPHKIVDGPQKSPKGMTLIIEKE